MTNIEMIDIISIMLLILAAFINAYIIITKRDERERIAMQKSICFSASVVIYLAILEIMISFQSNNFYVPLFYIIIIIIAGCGINLLVYPLYLQFNKLELPYIKNLSNEKKERVYRFLLQIDLLIVIFFVLTGIIYNRIYKKSLLTEAIAVWTCLYTEFLILSKMPKKKIIQPQIKLNMKQETVSAFVMILILFIAAVIFLIITTRIKM